MRRALFGAAGVLALALVFAVLVPAFNAELQAQCSTNGTIVTCTNAPGSATATAPITTLNVNSLTASVTTVSLTGSGAAPGSGTDLHVTCTPDPADCTIVLGTGTTADTCTVKDGAPAGTKCVAAPTSGTGPSGTAGPPITINVATGGFAVTGVVLGTSQGSNGGNGGNAYVAGSAGDGAAGANGGLVGITFSGNGSGIEASSLAGNGGNGGDFYGIGGSAGSGGVGGFGGDATVAFNAGSITTAGRVGISAFSRGGNGGSAGGGGGLVFVGGGGNVAGQAGTATITTLAGTSISTSGDYASGILAQSMGGGGGSGSGGFGLFYSGGGNANTGGNGGIVNVTSASAIVTNGVGAHGILAQSIGGGGGNAGDVAGLVALGGEGAGGGSGGSVTVTNTGSIQTLQSRSNAIEAQSIGGGGGNGANSGGLVSLGGNGAGTTVGGSILISNTGSLSTWAGESAGILAQSIGGGGGNGGTSGGIFAYGGHGGSGANGGSVTIFNGGSIFTGINGLAAGVTASPGIVAQSIGGGGGNGGGAIALGPGVSVAMGGDGGAGGSGGQVQILRSHPSSSLATPYTVHTYGDSSIGVMAQSIGGGGGNGGFAVSGAAGQTFTFSVGVATGGAGGPGGGAGAVRVETLGSLITEGDNSIGLLAQSIGGGGGNGGFALSAAAGPIAVAVGIGGTGGIGGGASSVHVSNLASITTLGENSPGLVAQSIGGGGGNGGFAGAGALGVGAVSVGIGGTGGSGGSAGLVDVESIGRISTALNNSSAILAQSLGGGGGNGGFSLNASIGVASVGVGVGGSGGGGASASLVTVDAIGTLTTIGDFSAGVMAQSIGGGGGNGGFSAGLAAAVSVVVPAIAVQVNVGGSGGAGSSAGAVDVTTFGGAGVSVTGHTGTYTIVTQGVHSSGVIAQSLGGGGGNGGLALSLAGSFSLDGVGGAAAGVGVGGSGGAGSFGSTVNVTSTHRILTLGDYSNGILAQSLGGGGGNGGVSIAGAVSLGQAGIGVSVGGSGHGGGAAAPVNVNSYSVMNALGTQPLFNSPTFGVPTIVTNGLSSAGIFAQSIGGGGGSGGFSFGLGASLTGAGGSVSVGGAGDNGGNGSTVTVTSYNNIVTSNDFSAGIFAQSLGGGGGNGGSSIGLGFGSVFGGSVSIGGFGAGGGTASTVTANSYGTIATDGLDSPGIFAQSLGGGGGNGGFSIAGGFSMGGVGLGVSMGGFGGGGGTSGAVFVDAYASALNGSPVLATPALGTLSIDTHGIRSNGIFAQSLGGGGGNGGFSIGGAVNTGGGSIGLTLGGFGGGGASAGAVMVTSAHNIRTDGDHATAVMAQSFGGGGGNGGISFGLAAGSTFAGSVSVGGFGGGAGNAAAVFLTSYGTAYTHGEQSHGISAQSLGGGGGNGGFSVAGGVGFGSAGVGVSVGGFGSGGGFSGAVNLTTYAQAVNGAAVPTAPAGFTTIHTDGLSSNGVFALSLGGGGGNGGFSGSAGISTSTGGYGVSVGGFGAGGGAANTVTVTSVHNIWTMGDYSKGLVAQSIGGGGGNGGSSISFGGGATFGGALAVGGFALSGGGSGADVVVTSGGTILTEGIDSTGVLAQSIGGGGGNGGFALSGALTMDQTGGAVSVGGKGSNGGISGSVTVNRNIGLTLLGTAATIETFGESSHGIQAQSLGGGGGNGGFAGAVAVNLGANTTLGVGLGGFGGPGNAADNVSVTAVDNIVTHGDGSVGLMAQSVGGGGGYGGLGFGFAIAAFPDKAWTVAAALGGFGAAGANAGTVTVDHTGAIVTHGDFADAILAESLGGGGGAGGSSISGNINALVMPGGAKAGSVSVGGFGGPGGAASTVQVTQHGALVTLGEWAAGIRAQSLGGGGGNGGLAIAGSISGVDTKQVQVAVGGFGGEGSDAGEVFVFNHGSITTGSVAMELFQLPIFGTVFGEFEVRRGRESHGIDAQSVGGGGGNGGLAIAGGIGLLGTNSDLNISATVGGFGGSGGFARRVDVTNTGNITTFGDAANGINAQSIGGGGGNAGSAISGLVTLGNPTKNRAVDIALSLGGFGGDGNIGGSVFVFNSGTIITSGAGSNGIFAESIGGGGGTAGHANSIDLMLGTVCTFDPLSTFGVHIKSCQVPDKNAKNVSVSAAVGGYGGDGNDAGFVEVNNDGTIQTTGNFSSGIVAQSIGGGGGSGGNGLIGHGGIFPGPVDTGVSLVLTALGQAAGTGGGQLRTWNISLGGNGGLTGDGGQVNVTNNGSILTTGLHADGIFAQSVGGGGGDGGKSDSGMTGKFSWGGTGGASGAGGVVTVNNHGAITTHGHFADAIFAQSLGGGGGDGGAGGGLITIGGNTGTTGNGGVVNVTNTNAISTFGDFATGILAQSIGGGGGNAGGNNSYAVSWTMGGAGGGDGGDVTVTNEGNIFTQGAYSYGINAASVGGSGGTAGGGGYFTLVAIGSSGGASGNGSYVLTENYASIFTVGVGADAIHAMSVGGGGGAVVGGEAFVHEVGETPGLTGLVTIGGSGVAGGTGGIVDVNNYGTLITQGANANGVYALSVGGGGGDGGLAIGLVAVGGTGGASGAGGHVTVINWEDSAIWTQGNNSNGIFAQSIGGGGGKAGSTIGGTNPFSTVSMGGSGTSGGAGGQVDVGNWGLIQTDGAGSQGILAQSIGGGGGTGGLLAHVGGTFAAGGTGAVGGNGGTVNVINHFSGVIITNGDSSTGIFAQSIGGGGGLGGVAIATGQLSSVASLFSTVALGGSGGGGGNGGLVTVQNDGTIILNGGNSIGILAQSVGGGGGAGASAWAFSTTLGGAGSVGGAGDVTVTNEGSIIVAGANSIGIFAQSVGGGGGLIMPGEGATTVTLQSGGSGDGGTVTVTNTAANIIVTGDNSVALYSQSVGGGGGFVATTSAAATLTFDGSVSSSSVGSLGAFSFSGSAGGSGIAKTTTVNQTGNLMAFGANSIGMSVQSQAPNGNGDIIVNILNPSADRMSIIAGGTGFGAGLFVQNGASNQINNAGLITSIDGIGGFAIRATTGSDRVNNSGIVIGSIDLGAGTNSFANAASGVFLAGTTVNLGGAGSIFANSGLLSPGDTYNIQTTNLAGSFQQSASGVFLVDLDLRLATADRINVAGAASLGGTIVVNAMNAGATAALAIPGIRDMVLISSTDAQAPSLAVALNSITLEAMKTAVVSHSLVTPNSTSLVLQQVIDYAPEGLSQNNLSIGSAVNAIQTAQASPAFAPLATALFFQADVETLGKTYDSLGGSGSATFHQLSFWSTDRFLSAVTGQVSYWIGNDLDELPVGTAPSSRAGSQMGKWRAWMMADYAESELPGSTSLGSVTTTQRGFRTTGGLDYEIWPDVVLGFAAGGGEYEFDAAGRETRGTSKPVNIAFYGSLTRERYYVSGALALSFTDNSVSRHAVVQSASVPMQLAGSSLEPFRSKPMNVLPTEIEAPPMSGEEHLSGQFSSRSAGGYFEAGYRGAYKKLEVTPFIGGKVDSNTTAAYLESAGSGPSMLGLSQSEHSVMSTPGFVGIQLKSGNSSKAKVRFSAFGRFAWKHEFSEARTTEASFLLAPTVKFSVHNAEPERDALTGKAGFQLVFARRFSVFTSVDGEFTQRSNSLSGSAGFRFVW